MQGLCKVYVKKKISIVLDELGLLFIPRKVSEYSNSKNDIFFFAKSTKIMVKCFLLGGSGGTIYHNWLAVLTILKNIIRYIMEKKKMFETTNQIYWLQTILPHMGFMTPNERKWVAKTNNIRTPKEDSYLRLFLRNQLSHCGPLNLLNTVICFLPPHLAPHG
jgi:hypothetical protein